VKPASGVVLNETVGRAPDVVAAGLPTPTVVKAREGSGTAVLVELGVEVGAASAVWVNCTDSCPIAVSTAAVLIALTSTVGAGAAPILQAVSTRAEVTNVNIACRRDVRKNISVPPRIYGQCDTGSMKIPTF
jgi:hypothetical protein